jgi:signal transduction histidine kinase
MSQSKILIVDDIPENLSLISTFLEEMDIEILLANNGKEALESIDKQIVDIILLDISMPEMNGFDVCERLKENEQTKDIPVIFLTARTQPEEVIKGLQLGAVDYITKPFNPVELVTRVRNHLNHKKANDLIQIQNEKLIELNSMKDKFFSIIAHDLKNPLGLFLTTSQYINDNLHSFKPDETKSFMEVIHTNAQKLHDLLNNLLQWSRSQSNRIQYYPIEFGIYDLVQDNLTVLSELIQKKKISAFNNSNKESVIYADVNMINTVIRNLISNAIKYTNEEGEITINTEETDTSIIINVQDDGVGIEDENIPKLFRIDINYFTSGTNNEEGTGLGLILCKEFIDKNNGKISVKSKINEGSTFSIELPKQENNENN